MGRQGDGRDRCFVPLVVSCTIDEGCNGLRIRVDGIIDNGSERREEEGWKEGRLFICLFVSL